MDGRLRRLPDRRQVVRNYGAGGAVRLWGPLSAFAFDECPKSGLEPIASRGLTSVQDEIKSRVRRGEALKSEREAHPMPKFVKLVTDDEATMLVNLETVTRIKDGDGGELTPIYFVGSEDHPLRVKESGQEILKRARAEW